MSYCVFVTNWFSALVQYDVNISWNCVRSRFSNCCNIVRNLQAGGLISFIVIEVSIIMNG